MAGWLVMSLGLAAQTGEDLGDEPMVTISGTIGGSRVEAKVPQRGGSFNSNLGSGYHVEGRFSGRDNLDYTVVGPQGPIYFGNKTGPLTVGMSASYLSEVVRRAEASGGHPRAIKVMSVELTSGRERQTVYPPDAPFPLPGTGFGGRVLKGNRLVFGLDDSPVMQNRSRPFAHPSQFSVKEEYVAAYVAYAMSHERSPEDCRFMKSVEKRRFMERYNKLARDYKNKASDYWNWFQGKVRAYNLRKNRETGAW